MKEHGLLLSAPMVRARAEGRKTQTRRRIAFHNSVVERTADRTQREVWDALDFTRARVHEDGSLRVPLKPEHRQANVLIRVRPRVQVGHRIWWKETYKVMHTDSLHAYPELQDGRPIHPGNPDVEEYPIQVPIYRATDPDISLTWEDEHGDERPSHWKPSLLMPRKWARFVDPVTAVRAERLLEITEADAKAEGVHPDLQCTPDYAQEHGLPGTELDHRLSYALLWERINGAGSWQRNELVWVHEWAMLPLRQSVS